jgi:hypothetical protein
LIYKDLLKDKNKYRYHVNKTDYSIGRYLDGHTLDGRYESDLRVEIVSPLDLDYAQYSEAGCINKSTDGAAGQAVIKLPDDKIFFQELRTWLKTNKFIRLNDDGNNTDLSRILADRGRENQERRKRLRHTLEDMLLRAECYALGQHLQLSTSSLAVRFDDTCEYVLENTYTKLGFLKALQQEPLRELSAVLTVDDIGQMGMALDGEEGNPQAVKEVEQFIMLRTDGDERLLVSDIIDRFSARPYGWPDGEILLILGRLAATGRISFHTGGPSKPLNDVFEYLNNSRRRREISVQKKRQTDDAILKKTRNLSRELFNALGPDTEKELFEFYCSHFNQWLTNLRSYKSKTDVGRFPGKQVIERAILTLERLMANRESFDFFKTVIDNKNDYLELEEDYRDIHEFFSNQLHSWQQLQKALSHFEKNQQALQKNDSASKALAELKHIDKAEAPYGLLHKVVSLVETIEAVNTAIVREKREHALARVEEKIQQLQAEIIKSGIATADLSNRLLRPLQLIKEDLTGETSIATIYMLQTQTAQEKLDDSLLDMERAVHAEAEKQAKARRDAQENAETYTDKPSQDAPLKPAPVAMPKPVVDVSAAKVFSKLASGIYLEKQEDVDKFVAALKEELQKAIKEGGRVRLK